MNVSSRILVGIVGAVIALSTPCHADTHFVWTNSPTPAVPYTNWDTAAHDIQSAINSATNGDVVLVTNGVYDTGGVLAYGTVTNRVVIDKVITVRSVNGPAATVIRGKGPLGDGAVRCAFVGTNAVLAGFTLTDGHTTTNGTWDADQTGGGAWCDGDSAIVSNCVIYSNSASYAGGIFMGSAQDSTIYGNLAESGGGAGLGVLCNCILSSNSVSEYGGGASDATLTNCVVSDNSSSNGGGVAYCTLVNCTLSGNSAYMGGGSLGGVLYNCAVYGNAATFGGGTYADKLFNCTVSGNSATNNGGGVCYGELTNCIVYYNTAGTSNNIYRGKAGYCCTTPDPGGIGNITNEPAFVDYLNGNYLLTSISPCINVGNNTYATNATDLAGKPRIIDGIVDIGAYEFRPTYVHYVWTNSPSPATPFTNWLTAAHDIQSAIDASFDGDTVIVTNGTYNAGGLVVCGTMTNRIAVASAIIVSSVTGPAQTIIEGGGPMGDGAIRCAYVGTKSVLNGFTLMNGATRIPPDPNVIADDSSGDSAHANSGTDSSLDSSADWCGGGVLCETTAVVTNCVLSNNCGGCGGGIYGGTLNKSTVLGNSAPMHYCEGGGAAFCTLNNCIVSSNFVDYGTGGGVCSCVLNNCRLLGNSASNGTAGGACSSTLNNCFLSGNSSWDGGAVYNSMLNNCTLSANIGFSRGGGASSSTLNNCMLSGNTSDYGGGVYYCTLNNCIIWWNTASHGPNYYAGTLNYCCATPDPVGVGNITNEPVFVDYANGDYHLSSSSMCINAGNNAYVTGATDLDGNPRIQASVVDMGAYESPYAPIDASATFHGSITPAGRIGVLVSSNQSFTMSVTPGYPPMKDLKIDGVSTVPTNSFTFVNLTSNHTIEAIFWAYPDTNGYRIAGMNGCDSNGMVLSWAGTNGWTYNLQKSPSLLPPVWSNVPPFTNLSCIGPIVITNDMGTASPIYFRLKAVEN